MVEGARLEIVWGFTALGGSNPLASAREHILENECVFYCLEIVFKIRTRTFGANPLASARMHILETDVYFCFV